MPYIVAFLDRAAAFPRFVWCGSEGLDLINTHPCPDSISPEFASMSGYILHEMLYVVTPLT